MANNRRRGGRTTPKGTRPPHLRPVGDARSDRSPVDEIIDSGARELLEEGDPVAAETWASAMVDTFERARLQARLDRTEVPPFEEALLHRCRQRGDRNAAIVATALSAVATASYEELAASVAAELRRVATRTPDWLGAVGMATPTRSWVTSDVFGDQESLVVAFREEGRRAEGGGREEHTLVVLVDHNLSGQAKDAWIGTDPEDVVSAWESGLDRHMWMEERPVDETLAKLRDAMAMSDLWNGDVDLRTEDFAEHRALVWARLRRAGLSEDGLAGDDPGDEDPGDGEITRAERQLLVADFMASSPGRRVKSEAPDVDVELLAHYLVDLRADYEGRPLRWSPTVVAVLLGDLVPRKLLIGPDEAAALPAVVRAFVEFSAERNGMERVFVYEILAAVAEAEPEYLGRMADPAAGGPAKAVLAALQARGVDLSDLDAVNAGLESMNVAELAGSAPTRRRPNTRSAPDEVVESAARAPALARFDLLAGFYSEGRKLTQTGQPTLADTRQLVSLLGTDDHLDETIGDKTFKTRSAAELPELGFTLRWAQAAGALRKQHGKLHATKTWAKLEGKPLERWTKAADQLPELGPLASFWTNNRFRGPNEILDEMAPEILYRLESKPMAFDDVVGWVFDRADLTYEWLTPFMQDPEHRRMSFEWDLDRLARILGWAGIMDRIDATTETDRYRGERLKGGRLQLTPVGRWWLTEQ